MDPLITSKATRNQPTYATKAKITPLTEFNFPTSDQGIIFPYIADAKIRDYLIAMTDHVGDPKHIIAASRISNNRVTIFLSNTQLVDTFLSKSDGLMIMNQRIVGRPMKNKPKKIILSNVSPTISNVTLEKALTEELHLELASKISILRINPSDDIYGHVISNRRQVYVKKLEEKQLPGSFLLLDNETQHRIFITYDEFSCFKCHSNSHKAEDCDIITEPQKVPSQTPLITDPTKNLKSQTDARDKIPDLTFTKMPPLEVDNLKIDIHTSSPIRSNNPSDKSELHENFSITKEVENTAKEIAIINNPDANRLANNAPSPEKRRLSNTDSNSSSQIKLTPKKKTKQKEVTSLPTEVTAIIQEYCTNHTLHNITCKDLLEFLLEISNIPTADAAKLIDSYTSNKDEFMDTIKSLKTILPTRNIKNRLSRIIRRAEEKEETLNSTGSDSETV